MQRAVSLKAPVLEGVGLEMNGKHCNGYTLLCYIFLPVMLSSLFRHLKLSCYVDISNSNFLFNFHAR